MTVYSNAWNFESDTDITGWLIDTVAHSTCFAENITSTIACTDNTWTALNMNAEKWDTDTIHDNTTNNTRFTAPEDGLYLIIGSAENTTTRTDYRLNAINMKVNGSWLSQFGQRISYSNPGGHWVGVNICNLVSMSANDYAEIFYYQDNTGNQTAYIYHTAQFIRLGGKP